MTCEFLISSSTLLVNFGIVQYLEMLLVKYFGEGLLHSNWNLFFRLAEEVPVNCVHFSYFVLSYSTFDTCPPKYLF